MVNSKKIEVNIITMLFIIILSLYKNNFSKKNKLDVDKKSNNLSLEDKWNNIKLKNN